MNNDQLIPTLFRSEFGKMVSVICKTYGLNNIQFAEDVVSATFLAASETWGLKGIPNNPTAWLYSVAKNKTKDEFKRNQIFHEKIEPELINSFPTQHELNIDLSESTIQDSQLQMIFAVCHPAISPSSQIALALRVLCGFGIDEIAQAFLASKDTINKRLQRSKAMIRDQGIKLKFPDQKLLKPRLNNVLSVLYLLFNEGYASSSNENPIRKELCLEAMRLTFFLLENKETNVPETNALLAMFCFHASRFDARQDQSGEPLLYYEQNHSLWDKKLIRKGQQYLSYSKCDYITKYHLEASIAFWHTQSDSKLKWESILRAYNRLLQEQYSPITALNRTYALSRVKSKNVAYKEALKINLKDLHYYHALLAELAPNPHKSFIHLENALALTTSKKLRKKLLAKQNKLSDSQ